MHKIQTFNQISDKGLSRFPSSDYEVSPEVEDADAIVLRSFKLSMDNVTPNLKAVGRAGAGVNNVPVDDYTKQGIVVFNTPGANANAVKELVICGMLLASRGIVPGINWVSSLSEQEDLSGLGPQVEAGKKNFKGSELAGKTLGIVGLGAIGAMVANAAIDLGMKVLGYDPAISIEAAWRLSNQVEKQDSMSALLAKSDFVSLHLPMLDSTRNLIDEKAVNSFKPGCVLLNFSRDAIVNTKAILQGMDSDRVGKYICDFPTEELLKHEKAILLPHIGASTEEAEDNCAVMAVDQIRDFLENGNITNSVNFPQISLERNGGVRLAIINENVPGLLGKITSILADKDINVLELSNKSRGDVAYNLIDIESRPDDATIADLQKIEHVTKAWII
ncbi:MAG: 3-phosphoglycerate dehydrogenase [SAR86 cluster bacterium]|uniref:D-3-phosphoglycerate dehydrogenase n=1 Tax=SAR86 cluster bacterium TaxID=2030880 RepID=A0A2A5CDG9_9GAMM|nr:phosphoglycerate dehydrogenase [Gammaproteobacteria bacterium AH-315-E17]PCJ41510.1 MAG: 3-phosphoglycerate dehydrogenase [SAR86 cluster bacterium]